MKLEENGDASNHDNHADNDDECGLVKSLKYNRRLKELREVIERNNDIRQRLQVVENDIKTSLRTVIDNLNDRLSFLRTGYDALLVNYNDLRNDHRTLSDNHELLSIKQSDDLKDILKRHNHLPVLHSNLNRSHLEVEDKLKRVEGDITQTTTHLEQLGSVIQKISTGVNDLKNDLTNAKRRLDAKAEEIADTNIKTNILKFGLREQRTDFDNHVRYAERLKDLIDNTRRKIEKYSFMFENYKIVLLESEFIDKNIEVFFERTFNTARYLLQFRSNGRNSYLGFDNFNFGITNIRDYFSNFSFDMDKFSKLNRIIPVYDFDLIMNLYVEKVEINPLHSPHICGFIFNYIAFKISEITLYDEDNSINHRTLHEFKIRNNTLTRITKRLHLKANKQYEFNFLDEIGQRVIDHKDERYDVHVDFRLRFYYTTDKDRNFDDHHRWVFRD